MVAIDGCAMSVVDGAGGCHNQTMGVGTTLPLDVVAVDGCHWKWGVVSVVDSRIKLSIKGRAVDSPLSLLTTRVH